MGLKEIKQAVKESTSKKEVMIKLGYNLNSGNRYPKLNKIIQKNNIDISHFCKNGADKRDNKYVEIEKSCPVCGVTFKTKKGHPREKTVCSHGCSNTFFRSGENNPNWNKKSSKNYRNICFSYHARKCIVCGETKIVAVHHYDADHSNVRPENLIPLCPTHHLYVHSRYKDEVLPFVKKFIRRVKKENLKSPN